MASLNCLSEGSLVDRHIAAMLIVRDWIDEAETKEQRNARKRICYFALYQSHPEPLIGLARSLMSTPPTNPSKGDDNGDN